jgi:OOP family OmpA-OmpF porin
MNMQHKLKTLTASFVVFGSIAAMPAHAQFMASDTPYNPSWYGVFGGNYFDPEDGFNVPENGGGLTARIGKPIHRWLDLQLGTQWSRAWDSPNSVRQNTLTADALFMFSRSRLRPFLLVGGGAEYDSVQTATRHNDAAAPYLNAGLGLQYLFTDTFGMQIDYRWQYAYNQQDDFGFQHAKNQVANVGLIWVFGKPPAPVPVKAAEPPTPVPVASPAPVVQAPLPSAPVPPPAPRFEKRTMSATRLFEFNSAVLAQETPQIDEIAAALNKDENRGVNITVNGYTDRLGSDKYNLKLSQERADTVKAKLVSTGIAPERINAVGKGEANPVVTCNQKSRAELIKCLEPNRRVEVEDVTVSRRVN